MSAATSGHELPLKIIDPLPEDLDNLRIGSTLIQRKRICGSPQERFSKWVVRDVNGDQISVAPLKGLYLGCKRQGERRIFSKSLLLERFKVAPRRIC